MATWLSQLRHYAQKCLDSRRKPYSPPLRVSSQRGRFAELFLSAPHVSSKSAADLAQSIRERAARIGREQPFYQPIFGFEEEFPAKRRDLLERDCAVVAEHLSKIPSKHQVRILDVGCNCGYVAFNLARTFPNVVGLEIAGDRVELCTEVAAHNQSSARFFKLDFIELMQAGDDDLENVDAVLLLNVVHQFVFAHGLGHTQAMLARLASRVDSVFVELATREQYVKHGKDHLLPENPEEVFAACRDIEITQLASKPRPMYLLRRRRAHFGHVGIAADEIGYSLNANPQVSRKYYSGRGRFLKVYRLTAEQDLHSFHREVAGLLQMRGSGRSPEMLDWVASRDFGAIAMSHVKGPRLIKQIYSSGGMPASQRMELTRDYLALAAAVFERVGFHNDMQAHNLIAPRNGPMVLIDFEQAGPTPTNDPFGILLWTVFDLWGGRDPKRPEAIRSLKLAAGEQRASSALLPDFSKLSLDPRVAEMVEAARSQQNWEPFINEWRKRLAD